MLDKYIASGVIYFSIDFSDGESMVDAYAIVTADVEYEPESTDCPSSCNYKVNPDFTVHYEGTAEEIDPTTLRGCEFIISTYVSNGLKSRWKAVSYNTIAELIKKEQLSIDWED